MNWFGRLLRRFRPARKADLSGIEVTGFPPGPYSPDQCDDDDPYMRIMMAASMNLSGTVFGEIDDNGNLIITRPNIEDED